MQPNLRQLFPKDEINVTKIKLALAKSVAKLITFSCSSELFPTTLQQYNKTRDTLSYLIPVALQYLGKVQVHIAFFFQEFIPS